MDSSYTHTAAFNINTYTEFKMIIYYYKIGTLTNLLSEFGKKTTQTENTVKNRMIGTLL